MKIQFYRYLSEDEDIIEENYGDKPFTEACVLQLHAEIKEQDSELAAMIKFGEVDADFEPYTINATLDQVVSVERIQTVYDLGVAGGFKVIS